MEMVKIPIIGEIKDKKITYYKKGKNMNDFLPKDYKEPEMSNYMKFSDGDNIFRILSKAIIGFQYFTDENKPVRSKVPFTKIPNDIKVGGQIKHIWAFVV